MRTITDSNIHNETSSLRRLAAGLAALLCIWVGISDAGISRNGISNGRITQFASIFVNDREYDISGATITIDGQLLTEADLRLGQVVTVRGDLDDVDAVGVATEVLFGDNVEGPISDIDADEEQLTVLGQTILTDVETVFDFQSGANEFDGLNVDDRVEVSGFVTAAGEILATRIEEKAPGGALEVTGIVSDLDLTASTFAINNLAVDFSSATPRNFPTGSIADGDFVEAKGSAFGANGELIALEVELQDQIVGAFDDFGEFEGLISSFSSASDFFVGGIHVNTDEHTGFVGGGPANLTNDSNVVVRGVFDDLGFLLANDVTIRGTRIRVYGLVDSSSDPSLTALGVPLLATAATEIRDKTKAKIKPFSIGDIHPGDYVEARSLQDPSSIPPVILERIRREDRENSVLLQGFVEATGAQAIQVFGVTIFVTNETEFFDASDNDISAEEFFNAITAGTFVKVRGTAPSNLAITANDISLQIHD